MKHQFNCKKCLLTEKTKWSNQKQKGGDRGPFEQEQD